MSGQGIDRDLLVAEMMRVIYERQLEYVLDDLMVSLPEAMSLDFIDANANAWQAFLIKNRRQQWTDFDKVMDRVRGLYGAIRQDVINKVELHMIDTSLLTEHAEKPALKSKITRGAELVSELKGKDRAQESCSGFACRGNRLGRSSRSQNSSEIIASKCQQYRRCSHKTPFLFIDYLEYHRVMLTFNPLKNLHFSCISHLLLQI